MFGVLEHSGAFLATALNLGWAEKTAVVEKIEWNKKGFSIKIHLAMQTG